MKFKILCYFALIIAFFMFYQREPVFTVIIIGVGIGVYAIFKLRKKGRVSTSGFFSGKQNEGEKNINNLILLMLLQQMFNTSPSDNESISNSKESLDNDELDEIKEDMLQLLDDN